MIFLGKMDYNTGSAAVVNKIKKAEDAIRVSMVKVYKN